MLSAKLLQLCPALCNLVNHNLPGSAGHGFLQARILEWVAMACIDLMERINQMQELLYRKTLQVCDLVAMKSQE